MEIIRKVRINSDAGRIWDLVGPGYANVDRWASGVYVSKELNTRHMAKDAPIAGRTCETAQGSFVEKITNYDPAGKKIAYSVSGKSVPGFVKNMMASWSINPVTDTVSDVTMRMNADIGAPFNFLMGWMMKKQFGKAIEETLEEIKHYVEAGATHPRKVEANKTPKAKKALAAA